MDNNDAIVKFVRFKTGDDVISEIVELVENNVKSYTLINPLKVIYIPNESGESFLQVAFIPWVFKRICEEQTFEINSNDILTIGNITEGLDEYYWETIERFNSGDYSSIESDEPEDIVESEDKMEQLQEILQAIQGIKRTFH